MWESTSQAALLRLIAVPSRRGLLLAMSVALLLAGAARSDTIDNLNRRLRPKTDADLSPAELAAKREQRLREVVARDGRTAYRLRLRKVAYGGYEVPSLADAAFLAALDVAKAHGLPASPLPSGLGLVLLVNGWPVSMGPRDEFEAPQAVAPRVRARLDSLDRAYGALTSIVDTVSIDGVPLQDIGGYDPSARRFTTTLGFSVAGDFAPVSGVSDVDTRALRCNTFLFNSACSDSRGQSGGSSAEDQCSIVGSYLASALCMEPEDARAWSQDVAQANAQPKPVDDDRNYLGPTCRLRLVVGFAWGKSNQTKGNARLDIEEAIGRMAAGERESIVLPSPKVTLRVIGISYRSPHHASLNLTPNH